MTNARHLMTAAWFLLLVAVGVGPARGAVTTPAAATCAALTGTSIGAGEIALPTRGATIFSARLVPAGDAWPEHCRVEGAIASVDPAAQPIQFAVVLPTEWNGKLMQDGGGGLDGVVVDPAKQYLISGPTALQRGYAVVGSDSGHSAITNSPYFAFNDEELRNFAGDQLKKTHDTAVALLVRRYGAKPAKSYFVGGSEGGRESVAAVQRFPADYDGVVTVFPVFNWVSSFTKWQMVARAMRANNGAGWISPQKLDVLRQAELAACDGLDGIADGVISNVMACKFDPQVLLCPGGSDQGDRCFSAAQVATVRVMNTPTNLPYPLANGNTLVPQFYPGTAWTGVLGTSPTFTRPDDIPGIGSLPAWGTVYARWLLKRDLATDILAADPLQPGADLKNLQAASAIMDMTNPDISAFMARGGKWIVIHGLSDGLPPAAGTVAFYQSLVRRYGQSNLDRTLRFYTIPGYGHLQGAFNATYGMPALEVLEGWVEQGRAPDDLVVADTSPGADRTRPMCVFPRWPKYKGRGNPSQAANFECATE